MNDGLRDEGVIARGGAGVVRLIYDEHLDRHVAKKMPDDARNTERFTLEARMTARLEHPNIAPVYAFGVDDNGVPWFTMRRVAGQPFDAIVGGDARARTPNDLHAHLEIFLKVCDAVSYAHSVGVIHRDLKPQNVKVGNYGEVYLLDWGSSMAVDGARDPEGVFFGTLGYCAPEQARGANRAIDVRTDVFGLGALLYHTLTFRPLYSGRSRKELLQLAQHALVVAPERVLGSGVVPKELVRVCMTALACDPAERYQSVDEMKRDLQTFVRSAWSFRTARYPAGAEIVREGDLGTEAFIITTGKCQVLKTDAHRHTLLRVLGPGDVFGETGALTGLPRTATIRAVDEVTVAVISFEDLVNKLALDSWSGKLVRTLADRFRDVDAARTALQRKLDDAEMANRALALLCEAGGELQWSELRARLSAQTRRSTTEIDEMVARAPALVVDVAADRVAVRP